MAMTETKNTPADFFSLREAELKKQKTAFKKLTKLLTKYDALEQEILTIRDEVLSAGLSKTELLSSLNPSDSVIRLLRKPVHKPEPENQSETKPEDTVSQW
ncbi:hypothetical protein [Arcanobacterium bovis]|uniref:DUF4315 family protein n=1 Tax=Arcanobacterium bovis TaxID=2529275 RepID=A0A4Q9V0C5_9ACTO|nr:hypothetical protein [Arcanobacterium bovis]TBW20766.1 hypothetical protein EZJ44_08255 [Arcanobacterium bovis]